MLFIILLLSLMVGTIAFGIYFEIKGRETSVAFFVFGFMLFIAFIAVSIMYYSSGKKATTLNKMFGTHYTRDDLFFSEKIIMNTIEGEKYRIIFEDNKKKYKTHKQEE